MRLRNNTRHQSLRLLRKPDQPALQETLWPLFSGKQRDCCSKTIAYLGKRSHYFRWHYADLFIKKIRQKIKKIHEADKNNAHNSTVAKAALQECRFKLVQHPPFSPNLAPTDYCRLPKMKELSGLHFDSDVDGTASVDHFF